MDEIEEKITYILVRWRIAIKSDYICDNVVFEGSSNQTTFEKYYVRTKYFIYIQVYVRKMMLSRLMNVVICIYMHILHRSFLSISISSRLFPASSFDVHKYNIENRVLMIG